MIKFEIEENVSKYFDKLSTTFDKEEKNILKEMMYSATGRKGRRDAPISKRLMQEGRKGKKPYEYNPWLFESGQEESRWLFEMGKEKSSVTANYSGMEGYNRSDEFKVWVEFSEEYIENNFDYYATLRIDAYDRTLDRDYAFYQETGVDKYADPGDADHIGFVNKGMGEAADKMHNTLVPRIKNLLDMI